MPDHIRVREKDQKVEYPLEKPAPTIRQDKVEAHVQGRGCLLFPLDVVIGWIFGGKTHAPDDRR